MLDKEYKLIFKDKSGIGEVSENVFCISLEKAGNHSRKRVLERNGYKLLRVEETGRYECSDCGIKGVNTYGECCNKCAEDMSDYIDTLYSNNHKSM